MAEMGKLKESSLHVILALSERLSKNRDDLPDILEIMLSWFRDILIYPHDPEKVINQDMLDSIRDVSERYIPDRIYRSIQAVQTMLNRIQTSKTNVQLSMDYLLLRLKAFQQ